ncbi:hypothetical protein [Anaerosporobacter sp.]
MKKQGNPNLNRTETFYSEKDLKDAMKNGYGMICVRGEIAKKVYKNIDNNPKLNKLSNVLILGGLFLWPLLLVGIGGKILTATDFKHYKIINCTSEELILQRI